MTVGVCDVPDHRPRERRASDADERDRPGVRRARVTAEPVVGAGTVEGDDAGGARAPPHELTVEHP